jgi:hypothetical protein
MTKHTEAAEKASLNIKNAVQNLKDASDTVQTIDPVSAGVAVGIALMTSYLAPKVAETQDKVVKLEEKNEACRVS